MCPSVPQPGYATELLSGAPLALFPGSCAGAHESLGTRLEVHLLLLNLNLKHNTGLTKIYSHRYYHALLVSRLVHGVAPLLELSKTGTTLLYVYLFKLGLGEVKV